MTELSAEPGPGVRLTPVARRAGALFLLAFAIVSIATGQQLALFGDLAQLVPPLAFVALVSSLAARSRGQVRVFWYLNAVHGLLWSAGQVLWTYYDLFRGGVPLVSPTDPIFFASSLPIAAALYGRPDRERPQWVLELVLLDITLIALFAAFAYVYFVVAIVMSPETEAVYNTSLTQLLNVRNLVLAVWALRVWWTAAHPLWRRVFGWYAAGFCVSFVGGFGYDISELWGGYRAGSLWDLMWMAPYALLAIAATTAWDENLLASHDRIVPIARLPVVSLFAVALLALIPVTDEIARRLLDPSPDLQTLRTHIALTMMIPFGVVVVVREFLSRRLLLRAGQDVLEARAQLAQQEKLAAMGRLVSGVAHELNNPLQGVLGYAELLLEDAPEGRQRRELDAISQNAKRAAGIVRNLMAFAGRTTHARSWLALDEVVRQAVESREAHLMAAGVRADLQLAGDLPPVLGDAVRLEQVIVNLLQNAEAAIDARFKGHSILSEAPVGSPGTIVVATRSGPEGASVALDVSDNGCGIAEHDLARLFEPFFTTRGADRPGLGLAVCYGIVHEHGGLIRGRNREGGGAVFTVELPIATYSGARLLPRPAPGSEPLVRAAAPAIPRALVVDDEESNAALLRRALERSGYHVDSSTVSRRAVTLIERTPYDVVIADVRMPEIGGPELYARVCQIRPEMAGRFIFVTGDIDGEDTRQFLAQIRCGYFMKPFNLERLIAAVDTLVGRDAAGGARSSHLG